MTDIEVGDYVERDEEIATIETDKVGILVLPRKFFFFLTAFLRLKCSTTDQTLTSAPSAILDRCVRQCARGWYHQGASCQ